MNRISQIGVLAAAIFSLWTTDASAENNLDAVREHLAKQEVDKAYPLLVSLVDTNTSESDAYLYLGVLERNRGELERAIVVFERGVSQGSTDAALLSELAMSYAWKKKFREALETYESILRNTPKHRGALLGSARVLAWAGQNSKATSIYNKVLRENPKDLEAMRGLAFVYRSRLEFDEAKALYRKILSESPDDSESLAGLRSIERTTRLSLELALGAAKDASGAVSPSGSAMVMYRYDHKTKLRAQWQSASTPLYGASSSGNVEVNQHRASIGISRKLGVWASAELGYQLRMGDQDSVHSIALALNLRLTNRLNLDLGLRPGLSVSGNEEFLVRGGVQYTISSHLYLMAQLFQGWSSRVEPSRTFVGSIGVSPRKQLSLRASAAKGTLAIGDYTGISLAVQQNTSHNQHIFLRGESTLEPFTQQGLVAGVGRSF